MGKRRVYVWVNFPGIGKITGTLELGKESFNKNGALSIDDAVGIVERWFTGEMGMAYGISSRKKDIPPGPDLQEVMKNLNSDPLNPFLNHP